MRLNTIRVTRNEPNRFKVIKKNSKLQQQTKTGHLPQFRRNSARTRVNFFGEKIYLKQRIGGEGILQFLSVPVAGARDKGGFWEAAQFFNISTISYTA